MRPEQFWGTDDWQKLVTELANIKPCPFAGRVTEDQIKIVLGEHGNIWPRSIEDDVRRNAIEEQGLIPPARLN